jgi:lipopolysaccharide transport system ATP-binding protein
MIKVQGLGKRYTLGGSADANQTFREMLTESFTAPVRRLLEFAGASSGSAVSNEAFWALRHVDFEVQQGEVVGIVGRNGAGKSTLLKILSRITDPTEGRVEIRGRVASLLEVGTGFHPELTGHENIYLNGAILGMSSNEISRKFDEIVAFAEVERFLDTPVKHYSSGMYVRLAFAVAAHLEPEILVVDEVLAVGDAAFQKKCLGKMRDVGQQGRTVLFVSHNMGAVSNLCDRGIVLERGGIDFDGKADAAINHYSTQALQGMRLDASTLPHVIYRTPSGSPKDADFSIVAIEMLDVDRQPKPLVQSWDDVVLRFVYRAERALGRGSLVFFLSTLEGVRLLLLSTQPDGTLPLDLRPGEHAVDCLIRRLPLAAGEYTIGGGLAIPNAEWLWQRQELAVLSVHPRDVYGSGLAPAASRCLLAVEHEWMEVVEG